MALHAADYERLNACLLRLYRELDAKRQERVMLEVIRELVPAESVVPNRFDVRSSTLELVTLPADLTTDEGTQLVAGYLNESPFAAYYVATRDAQWKMTTDFMPLEDFQATALYRQALRHWDINLQMCGLLALEASTLHAVTINRAQQALNDYQGVPAAEEALAILVYAYGQLGMNDLRDDSRRVLEKNYPGSKFLSNPLSGRQSKPWWQLFW